MDTRSPVRLPAASINREQCSHAAVPRAMTAAAEHFQVAWFFSAQCFVMLVVQLELLGGAV